MPRRIRLDWWNRYVLVLIRAFRCCGFCALGTPAKLSHGGSTSSNLLSYVQGPISAAKQGMLFLILGSNIHDAVCCAPRSKVESFLLQY